MADLIVALLEDAAGAVVFGEPQLLQRRLHIDERRNAHPSQAPIGLGATVGEPAVVAPRLRHLPLRPRIGNHQKERRIDDLDLGAQLVHVAQAGLHVEELAGLHDRPAEMVVADSAARGLGIHDPVAQIGYRLVGARTEGGDRLVSLLLRRHVLPGGVGLVNVRVGVNDARAFHSG